MNFSLLLKDLISDFYIAIEETVTDLDLEKSNVL